MFDIRDTIKDIERETCVIWPLKKYSSLLLIFLYWNNCILHNLKCNNKYFSNILQKPLNWNNDNSIESDKNILSSWKNYADIFNFNSSDFQKSQIPTLYDLLIKV